MTKQVEVEPTVSLQTAAQKFDVSEHTIRQAIRKVADDGKFPPPLPAKRMGRKYSIRVSDLNRWWTSLEDVA